MKMVVRRKREVAEKREENRINALVLIWLYGLAPFSAFRCGSLHQGLKLFHSFLGHAIDIEESSE